MRITTTYNPRTKCLDLRYDQEAKDVFTTSARLLHSFCDSPAAGENGNEARTSLTKNIQGLAVLARLGFRKGLEAHLRASDMRHALKVTCRGALYFCDQNLPYAPLDSAIVLLAGVTPIPLHRVSLPAPSEVFDKSSTLPEVWNSYRDIRGWNHSGPPRIFLIRLYQLWFEMRKISHPGRDLQLFVDHLGDVTELFRTTMGHLGRFELEHRRDGE